MLQAIHSTRENDPILKRILGDYVANLPEQVETMARYLAEEEVDELHRIVHQLKGSGGGYGFARITDLATQTEASILQGDSLEQVAKAVGELSDYIRRIAGYAGTANDPIILK